MHILRKEKREKIKEGKRKNILIRKGEEGELEIWERGRRRREND